MTASGLLFKKSSFKNKIGGAGADGVSDFQAQVVADAVQLRLQRSVPAGGADRARQVPPLKELIVIGSDVGKNARIVNGF